MLNAQPTIKQMVRLAQREGYPVTIKPKNGSYELECDGQKYKYNNIGRLVDDSETE